LTPLSAVAVCNSSPPGPLSLRNGHRGQAVDQTKNPARWASEGGANQELAFFVNRERLCRNPVRAAPSPARWLPRLNLICWPSSIGRGPFLTRLTVAEGALADASAGWIWSRWIGWALIATRERLIKLKSSRGQRRRRWPSPTRCGGNSRRSASPVLSYAADRWRIRDPRAGLALRDGQQILRMVLSGVLDRYPDLQVGLSAVDLFFRHRILH
jgi:hypothetical protein